MKYVNLGCGNRYHAAWINIDIEPQGPGVIAHDLSQGIPFEDRSCAVVYHSHILEHLRRDEALCFMLGCFRVLKPGGIVRVVVPDLERICRVYLTKLQTAVSGEPGGACDYAWMMLELYDQSVRESSGGAMASFLRRQPIPNEAFVLEQIGEEGRRLIQEFTRSQSPSVSDGLLDVWSSRFSKGPRWLSRHYRRLVARLLLGKRALRALEIGNFRLSGEVHHWMYDRYSLALLLKSAGFLNPVVQTANESLIPGWSHFNLDTQPDGAVNKPDSLFMEAIRPDQNSSWEDLCSG
ncbi:MAG: methyltransferase domain-containing protein [Acidobacteria bacterium]|nr:methyltransferase domain-containing protein [Acidobacteriota bacterium]MCI0721144.1 methyltransferase domain-containing protein [Acidobacteriota bacterium]